MLILCVEDEAFLLSDICEELNLAGYDVDEASNGVEALSRIEVRKPDLIISDISMPIMNGCELLLRIRCDQKSLSDAPVILMTAFDEAEVARRCSINPDAVIRKPIDYGELIEVIRRFEPSRLLDTVTTR
jgi:CheY-like chemotaxis protein